MEIFVIGQPGGDQCLIYHDGHIHLIGDAGLAVLVQGLAEVFQLLGFCGIFRGFVEAFLLEIDSFFQLGYRLMDLLFQLF